MEDVKIEREMSFYLFIFTPQISVPLLRFHTGNGEHCLSEINTTQRAQEERVADRQGKRGRRKGREG